MRQRLTFSPAIALSSFLVAASSSAALGFSSEAIGWLTTDEIEMSGPFSLESPCIRTNHVSASSRDAVFVLIFDDNTDTGVTSGIMINNPAWSRSQYEGPAHLSLNGGEVDRTYNIDLRVEGRSVAATFDFDPISLSRFLTEASELEVEFADNWLRTPIDFPTAVADQFRACTSHTTLR